MDVVRAWPKGGRLTVGRGRCRGGLQQLPLLQAPAIWDPWELPSCYCHKKSMFSLEFSAAKGFPKSFQKQTHGFVRLYRLKNVHVYGPDLFICQGKLLLCYNSGTPLAVCPTFAEESSQKTMSCILPPCNLPGRMVCTLR